MESRKRVFMAGLPEVRHRGNIRSDRVIDLLKPPPQPRARPSYQQQHETVSRPIQTAPVPSTTLAQNASCSSTPNIPNPKRVDRSLAPEPPKRATSASPTLASERYLLERVELLDHKLQAITEQLCLFTKILSNQSPAPHPQPTPDSVSYHCQQQQPHQHQYHDNRPSSRHEYRQQHEHRHSYPAYYEYPRDVINPQPNHQQKQQYYHQDSNVLIPTIQQRQPAPTKPEPVRQQRRRPTTPEEPLCDVSMASIDYLKRYNILE